MAQKVAYVTGGMGGIGTPSASACTRTASRSSPAAARAATSPSGSTSRRRRATPSTPRSATSADWESTVAAFTKAIRPSTARSTCWSTTPASRATACSVKMTREDWDAVIDTNLTSMFNVTKQVVPGMVEKGWGRIIQISSVNGEKGQSGQTNYSAAKAGMHGFTMALAQEVADQGRDGQHREPGLHRHRHGQRDQARDAGEDRRHHPGQAPGHAGGDRLDRAPGWRARTRASPPAPTSRATAACTWADAGARIARDSICVSNALRTRSAMAEQQLPEPRRADRARRELSHPPQRRMGDRDHRGAVQGQERDRVLAARRLHADLLVDAPAALQRAGTGVSRARHRLDHLRRRSTTRS